MRRRTLNRPTRISKPATRQTEQPRVSRQQAARHETPRPPPDLKQTNRALYESQQAQLGPLPPRVRLGSANKAITSSAHIMLVVDHGAGAYGYVSA